MKIFLYLSEAQQVLRKFFFWTEKVVRNFLVTEVTTSLSQNLKSNLAELGF